MKKTLEKLIIAKYYNSNELIEIISEFDLDDILDKAIDQIERIIQNNKTEDVSALSGILLTSIGFISTNH